MYAVRPLLQHLVWNSAKASRLTSLESIATPAKTQAPGSLPSVLLFRGCGIEREKQYWALSDTCATPAVFGFGSSLLGNVPLGTTQGPVLRRGAGAQEATGAPGPVQLGGARAHARAHPRTLELPNTTGAHD